ncbi:hypothetical protein BV22DRAFT_1040862 [Leucogyrophana mollusca]|uniref:Uncharacterized protein n=1 Tax=Leucogyrophana mollusca TaxID=85980 RepID=A0ACB8B3M3_9AGAM|nr:hypothetical protein BV22DRAFT_1040862 [Leucogyrophana mollusca]
MAQALESILGFKLLVGPFFSSSVLLVAVMEIRYEAQPICCRAYNLVAWSALRKLQPLGGCCILPWSNPMMPTSRPVYGSNSCVVFLQRLIMEP